MRLESYHNHSNWSDGSDSLESMVSSARDKGFVMYGFSDHWVERPDGKVESWSMDLSRLDEYVSECLRLKERYSTEDFEVKVSLEVEYFPENCESVLSKLRQYPFDYLIGAIHCVGSFSVDNCAEDWAALGGSSACDGVFHGYWSKMLSLCRFGGYDIVAHLDLPKKFGYKPSYDASSEISDVLSALAASGKVMELNTAGWDKACGEGYPSALILGRALRLGIPVVMSSDAHCTEHIGRHYDLMDAELKSFHVQD